MSADSNKRNTPTPAILALASAALFGASTPAAKSLVGDVPPQMLAGILYLGSGIGLSIWSLLSRGTGMPKESRLKRGDLPWLAGAIVAGGIAGPLLLMMGLSSTPAGTASLLLNMESVFTALLAWFVFKENFDRRIFLGMVSIVLGSLVLSWNQNQTFAFSLGSFEIVACCFCWALDNNLTRNISDADPIQTAAIKGLIAGLVNCGIGIAAGQRFPAGTTILLAAAVGLFGYGISLVLFIRSMRLMGTARSGAYFSCAPFVGALLSIVFLHESLTASLVIAGLFMALGIWLHLTETHEHVHNHEATEHEHMHAHDLHHQHDHPDGAPPGEPHSHWHKHLPVRHSHPHYPDTEHRHDH